MYYSQATVDNLLGEHAAIRGHLDLVIGLTREWKRFLRSYGPVSKSQKKLRDISEKRVSLIQAMGYLEDGLKNHHKHEDEVMPPLIGELLMRAIRIEHSEILEFFIKINSLLVNANLELFLEKGADVMNSIEELSSLASAHSSKEDGILFFLKKLPELK
jgi:hypothetical protein